MQLYEYDLNFQSGIQQNIRNVLDGNKVQMLVYGEKIRTRQLIITEPELLLTWQKYRPEIKAENVTVKNMETVESRYKAQALERIEEYFGKRAEDV